jgi:hypothetical protein
VKVTWNATLCERKFHLSWRDANNPWFSHIKEYSWMICVFKILPSIQLQLKVPSLSQLCFNCDLKCLEPQRIECSKCSLCCHKTLPNICASSCNKGFEGGRGLLPNSCF